MDAPYNRVRKLTTELHSVHTPVTIEHCINSADSTKNLINS